MMQDPRFELLRARVDAQADGSAAHEMRIDSSYLKELLDEIVSLRLQQGLSYPPALEARLSEP